MKFKSAYSAFAIAALFEPRPPQPIMAHSTSGSTGAVASMGARKRFRGTKQERLLINHDRPQIVKFQC